MNKECSLPTIHRKRRSAFTAFSHSETAEGKQDLCYYNYFDRVRLAQPKSTTNISSFCRHLSSVIPRYSLRSPPSSKSLPLHGGSRRQSFTSAGIA